MPDFLVRQLTFLPFFAKLGVQLSDNSLEHFSIS
jgi:hypothetical protein